MSDTSKEFSCERSGLLTRSSAHRKRLGKTGEDLAAKHLILKGYKILSRNYRAERGEIDIVAQDRDTIVFVEVKTASTTKFGSPETWVDERKQIQISKVASAYLVEHRLEDQNCRFDVVAILQTDGRMSIEHFMDAF